MKLQFIIPLILISFGLFFYLIGSFFSVSFDISKWSQDTRLATTIIYTTITFVCCMNVILANEDKN